MPSFATDDGGSLDFEVFCHKCGAGLCLQSHTGRTRGRGMPTVSVEPCVACMESARSDGFAEGDAAGFEAGHAAGVQDERERHRLVNFACAVVTDSGKILQGGAQ